MELDSFVFKRKWIEKIAALPGEQQDQILSEIVRYGTGVELKYKSDPVINSMVKLITDEIDFSKEKYSERLVMSQFAGRKKKVDDEQVLRLALQGKNSTEIAEILGVSKSSIDHSEGWKRRKEKVKRNENFEF